MSSSVHSNVLRQELRELIALPSPSRREAAVADHCISKLVALGFTTGRDHADNVMAHRGEPPYILLNAHMDTVQDHEDVVAIRRGALREPRLDLSYGFDNKVGIAIILALARIEELPFKVLLTTCEEIGLLGVRQVSQSFYDDVICSFTLDRGGYDDIITIINRMDLVTPEWGERVDRLLRRGGFVYQPREGRSCDALIISEHIPAFNISVGIYERHSKYEWVNVQQAQRTAKAMRWIIENRAELEVPE